MSASSDAFSDYMDDYGYAEGDSAVESFIDTASEDILAAHGRGIADAVTDHLREIADDIYEAIEWYEHPEVHADVYFLPGVSKLIESMSDYAA